MQTPSTPFLQCQCGPWPTSLHIEGNGRKERVALYVVLGAMDKSLDKPPTQLQSFPANRKSVHPHCCCHYSAPPLHTTSPGVGKHSQCKVQHLQTSLRSNPTHWSMELLDTDCNLGGWSIPEHERVPCENVCLRIYCNLRLAATRSGPLIQHRRRKRLKPAVACCWDGRSLRVEAAH